MLLRAEEQASAARRRLFWLLWIGSGIAGSIGLLYWRSKAIAAKRALRRNRAQLHEFARVLLDKNARLLELETALNAENQIETHTAEDNESTPNGSDLYNFRILTEQDWNTFKQMFERSYPNYLHRLRTAFPDITSAEERLSLLLKINLHRHEIATMLGVSDSTVKKGRARLRRRLALSEDQSLEAFLQELK